MKQKSWYLEMFANEDQHWWFYARRKMVKKILDSFFQKSDQNTLARILEIGCGTGGNLELLSTYGAMHAVEPNTEAREMANSRNVCLVRNGSLPHDITFEEKFDLICALDVLEYVDDDLAALKAIQNMLTPNGKLLLAVPAYMFLWSYHDIAVENKRRYTKNGLTLLTANAGFKPVYSTYFNMVFFPIVVIVRYFNMIFKNAKKSDVNTPVKFVNTLLANILAWERFFVPKYSLPFGVSLMTLLEKSK